MKLILSVFLLASLSASAQTEKLYPFYPCCGEAMVMVRPDPALFKWPKDSAMFMEMANYHNPDRNWRRLYDTVPKKTPAQKKPKKILRDTVWTSANRYDTIKVVAEDASGKLVKLHAVYEYGHYAAGKDMPRFHSYLNINKQRFTASQKPRKIRFDKMKAKGGN